MMDLIYENEISKKRPSAIHGQLKYPPALVLDLVLRNHSQKFLVSILCKYYLIIRQGDSLLFSRDEVGQLELSSKSKQLSSEALMLMLSISEALAHVSNAMWQESPC